jgi:2-phosphosulfolactate phosphatase
VLVGGFVNLTALQQAIEPEENVAILCAGTDGRITAEDALAAGLIAACRCYFGHYNFVTDFGLPTLNDEGMLARGFAESQGTLRDYTRLTPGRRRGPPPAKPQQGAVADPDEELAALLEASLGGQNLVALGCQADLRAAARLDRFDFVPELNLADWAIRRP